MSDVQLSPGPSETILDPEPSDALEALQAAHNADDPVTAIVQVCARWPRMLAAWASLGDALDEPALAYAAYRTGYHRGLDRLRANGWRGGGYVLWRHETNRGFLRSLAGLQATAALIGETDEDQRCALLLRQLDPQWPPQ
ncbi:MAG: DUF3151 family protein [Acidimicrobiaceae bacterium]|nr:DUF3151 family protein [Acidimicrobiaceae bacterium]